MKAVARTAKDVAFFAAIGFFVILTTFPFYWMLITSLKSNSDLYNVTNIPFCSTRRRRWSISNICSSRRCSRPGC